MTLDATHACVVDLDGVVWLEGEALPGAAAGVELLRARGVPVCFVTNNAAPTATSLLERLAAIGISASDDELVTSAQVAASMLTAGSTAYVVGEAGLHEALDRAGVGESDDRPAAVVVGLARGFDYDQCDRASTHVRGGARFVATNLDPTLPVRGTLRPGAGAVVAAIATAAGQAPEVAGKPSQTMASYLRARGDVGAVVGDRASTDGALAALLGVPFGHVRSAVDEDGPVVAAVEAATLLDAVTALLA